MKTSQKRATWYKERDKMLENQEKEIKKLGLWDDFKKSKYKTMTGFLKNYYKNEVC